MPYSIDEAKEVKRRLTEEIEENIASEFGFVLGNWGHGTAFVCKRDPWQAGSFRGEIRPFSNAQVANGFITERVSVKLFCGLSAHIKLMEAYEIHEVEWDSFEVSLNVIRAYFVLGRELANKASYWTNQISKLDGTMYEDSIGFAYRIGEVNILFQLQDNELCVEVRDFMRRTLLYEGKESDFTFEMLEEIMSNQPPIED